MHLLVCGIAIFIGTVPAWDAVVAVLGIGASLMALAMAGFMWKVDHIIARGFIVETMSDLFAAACTTAFAAHTVLGLEVEPITQILLRLMILSSSTFAQLHLFWVVGRIVKEDR